jgi:FKBP-type peptidyl-prolyl cis-trans isomerase (trigger factor)
MAKETPKKTIKKISNKMPKTSSKAKKTVKVIKKMRTAGAAIVKSPIVKSGVTKKAFNVVLLAKIILVIALGVVVFLLIQKNRGLFVAGTVNKSPISRWELNQKMAEKYGSATLEEIVSERLLNENLKKNKIIVTDKEVQDELASIKAQYGGETQFKAAIAQYGMTEAQATESIRQSVGLKKLIEATYTITISDADIQKYFTDNKSTYAGKTLDASLSAEIKDTLYQQQIYTKSQEWYSQIRKDAKVSSFI